MACSLEVHDSCSRHCCPRGWADPNSFCTNTLILSHHQSFHTFLASACTHFSKGQVENQTCTKLHRLDQAPPSVAETLASMQCCGLSFIPYVFRQLSSSGSEGDTTVDHQKIFKVEKNYFSDCPSKRLSWKFRSCDYFVSIKKWYEFCDRNNLSFV